ncbi:MAG: OmpA/MotB family protein [Candidatus Binatia bacterium]
MALASPSLAGRSPANPARAGFALPAEQSTSDFARQTASSRDDAGWLITLSDLSLLLLCFFIVLYVTDRRRAKTEAAAAPQTATAAEVELKAEPEEAVPEVELPEAVTISFAPGIADLRREVFPVLQEVASTMESRPELKLEIVGHTDDRPIATREYPTNWELSAARASVVARHLIEKGIDPVRLSVQGYAAFRPVLPNSDLEGRGANRRVELRYFAKMKDES